MLHFHLPCPAFINHSLRARAISSTDRLPEGNVLNQTRLFQAGGGEQPQQRNNHRCDAVAFCA